MSDFKSQAEVWQYLLEGGRVKYRNRVFYFKDGDLTNDNHYKIATGLHLYEEVKKLKPEREKIALYETLSGAGNLAVCDIEGRFPEFNRAEMLGVSSCNDERKARILTPNKPKCYIYADTFEIVRREEDE